MRTSWFTLLVIVGCGPAPGAQTAGDPKQSACASECQQREAACISTTNVSLSDSGAERRCRAQFNQCLNRCQAP